jgi:hypothetical protein
LCQMIDRHNRQRQDSLDIEKKVMTVHWERRVNLGLFGMMVVDAYHVWAGVRNGVERVKGFLRQYCRGTD